MKKIAGILLLIIYAGIAAGTAINFHSCKGHLAHTTFLNFGGKTGCSCNPDAMPTDCCKDELVYEKADNHKTVQDFYTIHSISPALPAFNNLYTLVLKGTGNGSGNLYNNSRRNCRQPIYLLIRVLRI